MKLFTTFAVSILGAASLVSANAGKAVEAEISASAEVTTNAGSKTKTLGAAWREKANTENQAARKTQETPADEPEQLIIDGITVSSADEYPFYVALVGPDLLLAPLCNGALIAPDVVLTAASCLPDNTNTLVGTGVQVGAYRIPFDADGSQEAVVIEQEIQPNFNFGMPDSDVFKNDLLLLRLDREIELEPEQYMRLSNYDEDMEPGEELTVIGFGSTVGGISSTPQVLQEGTLPVWFDGDCQIVWESQTVPFRPDPDVEVCAGGRTFQQPSFLGDNGAPLFREVNEIYYQVGVFSWGAISALPGVPGVFTQIPSNENGFDWIRQTVCGDWDIEALFCIECDADCECPDDYECICYEEVESRRRLSRRNAIENKLKFLDEGFLSPDHGKDDAANEHDSKQKGENKDAENSGRYKKGARRVQSANKDDTDDSSSSSKSSKSCKSGSIGKKCGSGEEGYCFRSDTALVDDFGGKKSSSSS